MLEDVAYDTEGDDERIPLYRLGHGDRGGARAADAPHPTVVGPISVGYGELAAAREELRACRGDVPGAEEDDRTWWAGLLAEANLV